MKNYSFIIRQVTLLALLSAFLGFVLASESQGGEGMTNTAIITLEPVYESDAQVGDNLIELAYRLSDGWNRNIRVTLDGDLYVYEDSALGKTRGSKRTRVSTDDLEKLKALVIDVMSRRNRETTLRVRGQVRFEQADYTPLTAYLSALAARPPDADDTGGVQIEK